MGQGDRRGILVAGGVWVVGTTLDRPWNRVTDVPVGAHDIALPQLVVERRCTAALRSFFVSSPVFEWFVSALK
jgi:hypothetical protein